MQIAKNRAVAIDYTLTIDGGIVVDASEPAAPLWYLHGAQNIIPGLERELDGLSEGDAKTVVVQPGDGYGTYDEGRVHRVPKKQFPAGSSFRVGDRVYGHSPEGEEIPARIKAVDANEVVVDFNHELAGKELTFQVKVASVRAATKEELAHGHVHGPGAHAH